jgi:hypothetical protein
MVKEAVDGRPVFSVEGAGYKPPSRGSKKRERL